MIVTVASFKGGVCKTTTAIHLAAYLNGRARTILFDDDSMKLATGWYERVHGGVDAFAFTVAPAQAMAMLAGEYEHKVIDTGQKPDQRDLRAAAEYSDMLVVPAVPSALDTDGLIQTLQALQAIGCTKYRVLLTRVAPDEAAAAVELRRELKAIGAPVFRTEIPRLKAFQKAAGAGVLVQHADDRQAARGWAAYEDVGRELVKAVKA